MSHQVKHSKKGHKRGVSFGDVEVAIVTEHKEKNRHYKTDKRRAEREATKLGGGHELAERSLAHAEDKCACKICRCSTHDHNRVLDSDRHIDCRKATIYVCKYPKCKSKHTGQKYICALCWQDHQARHERADEKHLRELQNAVDELKAIDQIHKMEREKEKLEQRRAEDKEKLEKLARDIRRAQKKVTDKKKKR
jgi:hypothetical protein